jgi:hypothetical protein
MTVQWKVLVMTMSSNSNVIRTLNVKLTFSVFFDVKAFILRANRA